MTGSVPARFAPKAETMAAPMRSARRAAGSAMLAPNCSRWGELLLCVVLSATYRRGMKKAPISMLLAGGTLLTLIVGTHSLPGAKAANSAGSSPKEVALAVVEPSAPASLELAPLSKVADVAPMGAAFAALLPETLAPTPRNV